MKIRMLLLIGILLVAVNSCTIPGTETQTTKPPDIATPEIITTESTVPEITVKEGVYENEVFSFSIPEGWGQTPSDGGYFDLGVNKIITFHNKSLLKKSVAFFTVASVALLDGENLESVYAQAYKKGPEIEDALIRPFEKDSMTGIELTYGRPWGEPRYKFHDIWLESGGIVYLLSFQAYPDSFEPHSLTFAAILDSFSFKQSQVVITEVPKPEATELPEALSTAFALPPATARIAFAAKGWTVPRSGEENRAAAFSRFM